jgi:hypothetical protein
MVSDVFMGIEVEHGGYGTVDDFRNFDFHQFSFSCIRLTKPTRRDTLHAEKEADLFSPHTWHRRARTGGKSSRRFTDDALSTRGAALS